MARFEVGDVVEWRIGRAKLKPYGTVTVVVDETALVWDEDVRYSIKWERKGTTRSMWHTNTWNDLAIQGNRMAYGSNLRLVRKKIVSLGSFMRLKIINKQSYGIELGDALKQFA